MPGAPDDLAVRIFIEFKRNETAVKGMLLLLSAVGKKNLIFMCLWERMESYVTHSFSIPL